MIARILISWGIVVVIIGFIQNATQLFILRFLLGVAEDRFLPGCSLVSHFLVPCPTPCAGDSPVFDWGVDHSHFCCSCFYLDYGSC